MGATLIFNLVHLGLPYKFMLIIYYILYTLIDTYIHTCYMLYTYGPCIHTYYILTYINNDMYTYMPCGLYLEGIGPSF